MGTRHLRAVLILVAFVCAVACGRTATARQSGVNHPDDDAASSRREDEDVIETNIGELEKIEALIVDCINSSKLLIGQLNQSRQVASQLWNEINTLESNLDRSTRSCSEEERILSEKKKPPYPSTATESIEEDRQEARVAAARAQMNRYRTEIDRAQAQYQWMLGEIARLVYTLGGRKSPTIP